mmetsp:Transcript_32903/g.72662  ORF Transcript_32903/g.72662 Transcript_32903/m.72662 type:complete len:363 (+) Transcript_32903:1159-2247(+)
MAGLLDGGLNGQHHVLASTQLRHTSQVLGHGLAGDSHAVPVDEALGVQVLEHSGGAAHLVHVLHHVAARGLEVSDEGHAVADALEVIQGQLQAHRACHGDQMQHGVGGSTQGHDGHDGVLKGLHGHDVTRLQVLLQQLQHVPAGHPALVPLQGVLSGDGGVVGQGHAQGLNGGGHSVGGVHATACTGAGAGVAHNVKACLLVNQASSKGTVALKCRDDVQGLVAWKLPGTWLDGTTIDHQARPVQASHGHQGAWHVLVAAWQGDVGVIPLGTHDSLNAVRDQVAGLQAEAHALCSHRNAVGHTNGIEPVADHSNLLHAALDLLGKAHQVHVARIALIPHRGDTNLGLVHVSFLQASSVEHRL